jgi:tetratricopeptide (TPR) repeat protein
VNAYHKSDLLERAEIHMRGGQYFHAAQIYQRLLVDNPKDVSSRKKLAEAWASMGNITAAENTYLAALPYAGNKSDILLALAQLFFDKEQYEHAEYYLDQLVPYNVPRARLLQGWLSLKREDWVGACRHLEHSVEQDPELLPGWRLLAEARLMSDRNVDAVAAAESAMALAPEEPESRMLLARALTAAECHDDAIACLQPMLEIQPLDVASYALAAQNHLSAGRLNEAREILLQAHAQEPRSLSLNIALGELSLALSDRKRARLYYEQALTIDPEDVHALEMVHILRPGSK